MEGSNTSMSDTSGNLLFYSNGCKIVNAKGELLANGDSINPATDRIWVNFPEINARECRLSIYDLTGRQVHAEILRHSLTGIDLSLFKPGAYFYSIERGNERINGRVVIRP